uniref:ABC-type transport system protein n=1 Tax=uncultured bacterium CSLG7 TaxID=1091577 RepID=G4WV38_9BACT|nr:ABC-type transport system protein [uncultured bacterium CSLG7]
MFSRKASVGAFLIGGTLLFGVGLFLIGSRQKVFSRGFHVYADFKSVSGLETGANVRVSGLEAGEVEEIQVPSQASSLFRVKLRLTEKIHPLVRQDSLAVIQTEGLVGDKFVEIEKGSNQAEECQEGGTISSKEPFDFADLMQDARNLFNTTSTTMESAGQVADNVNKTLNTFLTPQSDGKNGAVHLTETMASAQRAMTNLADDTEAMKHNFFLRGFFKKRGFYDLSDLTPEQYRTSKFVKDKSVKRVWLDGQIFSSRAKGPEELSPRGREDVDKAMADFVPDLPNRPIVVEGYSERGSPDERFLRSQQHAVALQRYLQTRFKLASDLVGEIPLGDTPPKSTGKQQWDGVALVMLP